jgi:heptosyltransferase-2
MQCFLIIQTAFIGDVILCTPVISELKRLHPKASIDVVVRKGNESLLNNHPDINTIIVWDKKNNKYRSLTKVIQKVRLIKYDEIINLQRFHSAGLICLFAKAQAKIGFKKNKFPFMYSKRIEHKIGDGTHEVERNLKTIEHHEGSMSLVRPSLYPSKEDLSKVQPLIINKAFFCMAPASVWETKKLPTNKWVELAEKQVKEGYVYLIGGPQDRALCEFIKSSVGSDKIVNTCGEFSLLQSAALMKDAKMNYVNDSGPLHLASSVNAPTTAFFCSTVPRFGFGPLADNSSVIEIDFALDCRPCGLHGYAKCPEGHFKCGKGIKIKDATQ